MAIEITEMCSTCPERTSGSGLVKQSTCCCFCTPLIGSSSAAEGCAGRLSLISALSKVSPVRF